MFKYKVAISLPFCLLLERVYPVLLTFLPHQIISPGLSNRDNFFFIKKYRHVYVHTHTKIYMYMHTYNSSTILYFHKQALPTPTVTMETHKIATRATVLTRCILAARILYLRLCCMSTLQWNGYKEQSSLSFSKQNLHKKCVHVN